MTYKNDVKRKYLQTKESLRKSFSEASLFLDFIEQLNDKGFHVGTHKNLHLYFKDSFLFYFNKVSPKIIEISSKPNGIIKKQTFNHSNYFFNLFIEELRKNNSEFKKDIEVTNNQGYKIVITQSSESNKFFKFIKNTLIEIEKKENVIKLSNQISLIIDEYQVFNTNEEKSLLEGIQKTVTITYYERNRKAREECLKHWGYTCVVCEFDFKKTYGKIGEEYIHVHHLNPISKKKEEYKIDPINDLRPVCANCHAMIHKKKEIMMIEKLKEIVVKNKQT